MAIGNRKPPPSAMTFEDLIDKLRDLSETNRLNGHVIGHRYDPFAAPASPFNSDPPQTWTLQPEHIELLARGFLTLQDHNVKIGALLEDVPGPSVFMKVKKLREWYNELQKDFLNLKGKLKP